MIRDWLWEHIVFHLANRKDPKDPTHGTPRGRFGRAVANLWFGKWEES